MDSTNASFSIEFYPPRTAEGESKLDAVHGHGRTESDSRNARRRASTIFVEADRTPIKVGYMQKRATSGSAPSSAQAARIAGGSARRAAVALIATQIAGAISARERR